jgi:hypothetical protein
MRPADGCAFASTVGRGSAKTPASYGYPDTLGGCAEPVESTLLALPNSREIDRQYFATACCRIEAAHRARDAKAAA